MPPNSTTELQEKLLRDIAELRERAMKLHLEWQQAKELAAERKKQYDIAMGELLDTIGEQTASLFD